MVHSFDKEAFMRMPMEIEVKREARELPAHDNSVRLLAPMEQTIVLHVGNQDYDMRDLVYRLLCVESNLQDLMTDFSQHKHKMEQIIKRQEDNIQRLKMMLG